MATRTATCNCGQLGVAFEGPDPEPITLCHCNECQKRTGSVFSVQARIPREQVTIEGRSKTWMFPSDSGKLATFRSCDSDGITYHFCPECGSTVYWEFVVAPDVYGVAIGALTDPTFPPPMGSGFEAYGHPWAMNPSALPMPLGRHDQRWPANSRHRADEHRAPERRPSVRPAARHAEPRGITHSG
jgi:hypothetical protein